MDLFNQDESNVINLDPGKALLKRRKLFNLGAVF